MYTRKILSAAAAVAVMSTGAMAFEAASGKGTNYYNYEIGTIVSNNGDFLIKSSYTEAGDTPAPIQLSANQKGDALIFPAFIGEDGFETEIVVRNTSKDAVVAKAVFYSQEDSEELLDFNIYLSGKDVCRFKIKDGKVYSEDGSIKTFGIYPHQVDMNSTSVDRTDQALIEFANTRPYESEELRSKKGYVVIFGMEQTPTTAAGETLAFHNDHAGLYAAYAATLDKARSDETIFDSGRVETDDTWRNIRNLDRATPVLKNSMFILEEKTAPNIDDGDVRVGWRRWTSNLNNTGIPGVYTSYADFTDVDNVLTGTVRISAEGRDMLLPATAITNFTDDEKKTRLLWTEGEYASIADRCIIADDDVTDDDDEANTTTPGVKYDQECVSADAQIFNVGTAIYTFNNKDTHLGPEDNIVLLTQPYKRLLAQLDLAGKIFDGVDKGYSGVHNYTVYNALLGTQDKVDTGRGYYFQTEVSGLYDEDEWSKLAEVGGTIITSGTDLPGTIPDTNDKELESIDASAFEKNEKMDGAFDDKNGFAEFSVGVPAIITQMIGSKAGASAEMNWVYSDIND